MKSFVPVSSSSPGRTVPGQEAGAPESPMLSLPWVSVIITAPVDTVGWGTSPGAQTGKLSPGLARGACAELRLTQLPASPHVTQWRCETAWNRDRSSVPVVLLTVVVFSTRGAADRAINVQRCWSPWTSLVFSTMGAADRAISIAYACWSPWNLVFSTVGAADRAISIMYVCWPPLTITKKNINKECNIFGYCALVRTGGHVCL